MIRCFHGYSSAEESSEPVFHSNMKEFKGSKVGNTVLHVIRSQWRKVENHAVPGHGAPSMWLIELSPWIYTIFCSLTLPCNGYCEIESSHLHPFFLNGQLTLDSHHGGQQFQLLFLAVRKPYVKSNHHRHTPEVSSDFIQMARQCG